MSDTFKALALSGIDEHTVSETRNLSNADLPITVMPFILRDVGLRGVDAVIAWFERRRAACRGPGGDRSGHRPGSATENCRSHHPRPVRGRVMVDPNR